MYVNCNTCWINIAMDTSYNYGVTQGIINVKQKQPGAVKKKRGQAK